jgi:hypothetical protein
VLFHVINVYKLKIKVLFFCSIYPSSLPFNLTAIGSFVSMTTTFQSVSPWSNMAIIPNTLTCFTSPRLATPSPISIASIGSLSPLAPVSLCRQVGSSHVFNTLDKPWGYFSVTCVYLWQCAVVPDITFMRETVTDKSWLSFFDILHQRIEFLIIDNLLLTCIQTHTCIFMISITSSTIYRNFFTSTLAFVHLGISTTMLTMLFSEGST